MKKWSKVIGVIAVAAFAALCLAACGGGSGSGGGSAASSSGAAAYDPIYVVKHKTIYSRMIENGEVTETWESGLWDYEYDDHGNRTQWTVTNINHETNESQTNTYTYSDYDENGYASKSVAADGTVATTEWTIEDGHAVKGVTSSGYTVEATYYADGKMKSQHLVYDDGRDVTVEYDENGRPAHQVTEGGDYPQTLDYEWTLDDQGRATGATLTSVMTNTGDEHSTEYTFDYDENGNISTVNVDGAVAQEIEYQKIDNPSTNAWVTSWIPQI